mmetsp:Transcript_44921/g.101016  ORF Transcript_44921/g.101016 Transcript_44921/m.101016 type:complete len:241 (-) Transcript_44921:123-845(-)
MARVTIATCATARATMSTARTLLACAARVSRKGESVGSAASRAPAGKQGRTTSCRNQVGKRVSSQSKMMTVLSGPTEPRDDADEPDRTAVTGEALRREEPMMLGLASEWRVGDAAGDWGGAGNTPSSLQYSSAIISRSLCTLPPTPAGSCLRIARRRPSSARYSVAISETCSLARPRLSESKPSCVCGLGPPRWRARGSGATFVSLPAVSDADPNAPAPEPVESPLEAEPGLDPSVPACI